MTLALRWVAKTISHDRFPADSQTLEPTREPGNEPLFLVRFVLSNRFEPHI